VSAYEIFAILGWAWICGVCFFGGLFDIKQWWGTLLISLICPVMMIGLLLILLFGAAPVASMIAGEKLRERFKQVHGPKC
jgi:hypothetical protein